MTPIPDYIGKDVYSRDEKKLGRVKNIWDGGPYETEHVLVMGRPLGNDIFVPANVVDESDDRLVVPYPARFVKSGPPLSEDRGASSADIQLLHEYYGREA